MIKKTNAKKVFVMAGTNDLKKIGLEEYEKNLEKLILSIKDSVKNVSLYLESVIPGNPDFYNESMKSNRIAGNDKVIKGNKIAEELCKKHSCNYIDLFSLYVGNDGNLPKYMTEDGMHLKNEYYSIWERSIKKYIYE